MSGAKIAMKSQILKMDIPTIANGCRQGERFFTFVALTIDSACWDRLLYREDQR